MSDEKTQQSMAMVARSTGEMAEAFFDEGKFSMLQRAAKMFARSPLVPPHMRGNSEAEGVANCTISLALAMEMKENPLVVMQNIYFVSGRAGWNATYMIAKANASGIFRGRLNWRSKGKGDALLVTCYATLQETGEVVEAEASMEMAKAEGWVKNSKYRTMPEQMLRYRSATLLVRLYCPEVMLGYHTADELEDVAAVTRSQQKWGEVARTVDAVATEVKPQDASAAIAAAIKPAQAAQAPALDFALVPDEPAWCTDLSAELKAYGETHNGEVPAWWPTEDVMDEAQASRLIDRLHAEQ